MSRITNPVMFRAAIQLPLNGGGEIAFAKLPLNGGGARFSTDLPSLTGFRRMMEGHP
jgi:hypothetical protein